MYSYRALYIQYIALVPVLWFCGPMAAEKVKKLQRSKISAFLVTGGTEIGNVWNGQVANSLKSWFFDHKFLGSWLVSSMRRKIFRLIADTVVFYKENSDFGVKNQKRT